MNSSAKVGAIAFALLAIAYLVPLGARPVAIPDETRYAEIPAEMIASGDWVVPRLIGLRYFEKPVLGYWLVGGSILTFGETSFAIRLPAVLATLATAGLVFLFARRAWGLSRGEAWTAPLIYLSSALVFGIGTLNVLDAPLTFFVAASLVAYFLGDRAETRSRRIAWLLLAGVACGLAFLTKGFLALLIPAIVVVPYRVGTGRWRRLVAEAFVPLAAACAVALPWCLAIHAREPEFWHYFFWVEHIERFTSGAHQHPEPWWYFVPVLLLGLVPWTFSIPAVIRGLSGEGRDRGVRFCAIWLGSTVLFFSLSSGKLITYVLPCLPAASLLITAGLLRPASEFPGDDAGYRRAPLGLRRGAVCLSVACAALAVSALVFHFAKIPVSRHEGAQTFFGEETGSAIAFTAVLAASLSSLAFVIASRAERCERCVAFIAGAPIFLFFAFPFVLPQPIVLRKCPEDFLAVHAAKVDPDTLIVTDSYLAPAIAWFWHRRDVFFVGGEGEFEFPLSFSDAGRRHLSATELVEEITRRARPICIVMTRRRFDESLRGRIPVPEEAAIEPGWTFLRYEGNPLDSPAGVRDRNARRSP